MSIQLLTKFVTYSHAIYILCKLSCCVHESLLATSTYITAETCHNVDNIYWILNLLHLKIWELIEIINKWSRLHGVWFCSGVGKLSSYVLPCVRSDRTVFIIAHLMSCNNHITSHHGSSLLSSTSLFNNNFEIKTVKTINATSLPFYKVMYHLPIIWNTYRWIHLENIGEFVWNTLNNLNSIKLIVQSCSLM